MAEQGILDGIGLKPYSELARTLSNVPIRSWFRVRLPIVAAATANATALIFPAGSIIHHAPVIDVKTAEATGTTKTVDLGISGGDEDGFIDGLAVSATGVKRPTLADGANTMGALLEVDESAGDLVPTDYVCTAATTICYTLGSANFAELEAYALVEATIFPS